MSLNGDGARSTEGANDVEALCEEEAAHPATACEDHCSDVPADDDFADQVRSYDCFQSYMTHPLPLIISPSSAAAHAALPSCASPSRLGPLA